MPPNRGARTEHWLATHGARLVRRAEQEVAGSNFAVRSGDKIKEWIQTRSSVGLFVATILISLVVVLSSLGLIWETLRKVRKRSSGKGWKQLQDERRSNQPLGRFYEPRQGQLYDPAPAPGMGQRQGGPVMMRQGHGQIQGQRGMPPPIPPMPRQYQQQHPAALQAGPNQRSTSAMPQEIVYQSSPVPTRENSQATHSTMTTYEAPDSGRTSLNSADTEPLLTLPSAPPAPPTSAPAPTIAPPSPAQGTIASASSPTPAATPMREPFISTTSITSAKPPTIELKRTWSVKSSVSSWLTGGEEKKDEEEKEKVSL